LIDPASALSAATVIDESVGLIEKLLGKLRAQPDLAALKLSAALDEIVNTYRSVDEAFTAYVSLALDKDALTSRSQELLRIAGGSLGVDVSAGRGHCHKIDAIYRQHLQRWFEKAFNREEQAQAEQAFERLGEADYGLFDAFTSLADQLQDEAKAVLQLIGDDKFDQARQNVLKTYRSLAPVQQVMAQGMKRMYALKDTCVGLAQTV
jgi:hypothetical protein